MTFSIRYKLMIAFAAMALLVTLIAFLAVCFSFHAGFLQYVNDVRYESLQRLVETVADEVKTPAQWQYLERNPPYWNSLLRNDRLEQAFPPDSQPPPNHHEHESEHRRPPSAQRFLLLDRGQRIIYGRPAGLEQMFLLPVTVQGEVLGYVGVHKLSSVNSRPDKVFVTRQMQFFIWIAGFSVSIALLAAYFLSRWMVAPIQRLVTAMNGVMQRDYTVAVSYSSNDEVGSLVQSFNQLTKSLGQHEISQQQWIADISHELRTPIASLRGELESVQDGVRRLDKARIDSLHEEVMRLQRIVDDLHQLSLSDLGGLRYRFAAVSVDVLIDELLARYKAAASEQHIAFVLDVPHNLQPVYGDGDRLQQLFQNLMQNSLRYTQAHNQLHISIDDSGNDTLTIRWEDGPPGVTDGALEKLFDRLYREEKSRNRQAGGSGLGLSICKAIVEAHNGNITASHGSMGGLLITIQLPLFKSIN